jgi:hypothetical protein
MNENKDQIILVVDKVRMQVADHVQTRLEIP